MFLKEENTSWNPQTLCERSFEYLHIICHRFPRLSASHKNTLSGAIYFAGMYTITYFEYFAHIWTEVENMLASPIFLPHNLILYAISTNKFVALKYANKMSLGE